MPVGRETGWERIYAVVRRIPRGRVATYGDVAELAGMPGRARQVGWALHALGAHTRVPWQRVLNARGEVSPRGEPAAARVQRALLEREGIRFGASGRLDLARYRWQGREAAAQRAPARAALAGGERSAGPRRQGREAAAQRAPARAALAGGERSAGSRSDRRRRR